jgi:hypothetical protein
MKHKIKQNRLQVGRSITVELLKPIRIGGKPTHEFVFSKTLKTRLWSFGKLTRSAKERLYEFWHYLEFFLEDEPLATRNRIVAQVEAVIPRLDPADYAETRKLLDARAASWRAEMAKPSPYDHLPIAMLYRK